MRKLCLVLIIGLAALNANAATLTVTSNADAGAGSLRQIVANAASGDTIVFAPNVTHITLTSGAIVIDTINRSSGMRITIDGGDGVIISGNNNTSIFRIIGRVGMQGGGHNIPSISHRVGLNNLTFENSGETAIVCRENAQTFLTNCTFRNNYSPTDAGALEAYGSAVILTDCSFYGNTTLGRGGAILSEAILVLTNCTFYDNNAERGGAIFLPMSLSSSPGSVNYFYHCTFTENKATIAGGAIHSDEYHWYTYIYEYDTIPSGEGGRDSIVVTLVDSVLHTDMGSFYTYNCVYVGNVANGVITATNQIETAKVVAGDLINNNLLENTTTVTKATVFGTNIFSDGYIAPFPFARTATILTESNIAVWSFGGMFGVDAPGVIAKLVTDQIGVTRPTTGKATFGAVEIFFLTAIEKTGGTVEPSDTVGASFNSLVTLTATADDCHTFQNWTNNNGNIISTENPLDITIISDTTLIANFEIKKFDLTVSANENGSVTPSGTSEKDCGSMTILTAVADSGYKFLNWTNSAGNVIATNNPRSVTVVSDTTLIANFVEQGDVYTVTLISDPVNGGTLFGEGDYTENETASLFAIADECYIFVNWTDAEGNEISTNSIIDIVVVSDTTLIANFELLQYDLTITASTGGTTNPAGTTHQDCGSTITVTATPTDGYKFLNWRTVGGTIVSTANPLSVKILSDTTLIANFIDEDVSLFEVTLIAHPASYGSVTGMGDYAENTIAIATASTDNCHTFLHWTDEAGNVISADNPFEIIVISDTTLYANFEVRKFDIVLNATTGGSVSGYGEYDCGSPITITAVADSGYIFVGWTNLYGDTISKEDTLDIIVFNDMTLLANFEEYITVLEHYLFGINVFPNPAVSDFTVSLDVLRSCNLQIVLLDMSGRILLDIFDGFVSDGAFSRTVTTNNLSRGVYFLNISLDGNSTVEKVVVE